MLRSGLKQVISQEPEMSGESEAENSEQVLGYLTDPNWDVICE